MDKAWEYTSLFGFPLCAQEKEDFEAGDTGALLRAIAECARRGIPLPPWAAAAFCERLAKVEGWEVDSWEDVFGRIRPKHSHKHSFQRDKRLWEAHDRVMAAKKAGRSIGSALFEDIGREIGISGASCSKCYYKAKKILENPDNSDF
jgi:hypothetical protein